MFGMYMYFYTLYVHVYIYFIQIHCPFLSVPIAYYLYIHEVYASPVNYTLFIRPLCLPTHPFYIHTPIQHIILMTLLFHYLLLSNYYAMHDCARHACCGVSWHLVNTPQVHTQSCCVLNTLNLVLRNDN